MPVLPSDVIEEPDFFDTYPEMAAFFERQTALSKILHEEEVTLMVRKGDEPVASYRVKPARPSWQRLPSLFWFQVIAGCTAFLVSLWVLVLRPRDLAVRFFAAMGTAIPGFTIPAAIYGTRELAMPGDTFRILSSLNHAGANAFGWGLVAFFLTFPARLVRPRVISLIAAVIGGWLVLDIVRVAPNQNWGSRAPIMLEMLGAIALGIVQWWATRGDPRGRALLRWLGVSVLVGSALFVFSIVGSSVIGWFPPMSQGYSFGFFLLMHVSIALGLRRHRLFDLDEWAYKILFWVLAGLAVIGLDTLLIAVLDANRALSTWAVLLVCGFLYMPVRSWMWSRAVSRKTTPEHELFEAVLHVTFAPDRDERARLWKALLTKLFDPVELRDTDEPLEQATVRDDGIRLDVPAAAGAPALRLDHPWRGRGLFGARHEELANHLVALVRHAESRREAFERGVRDERSRIARDMHDDVGAGLLTSLYRTDLDSTRDAIRQAIGDVRSIVHELTLRRVGLVEMIAEMRQETVRRLDDAKITVDWPLPELPEDIVAFATHRHLTSMVRELTTNVIRHSRAKRVRVGVALTGERLTIEFADNGIGFDPKTVSRGAGLDNLERRAGGLDGKLTMSRTAGETLVHIEVRLAA